MAVILICGKICSGKTTYSKKLARELRAVRLSCDEITLALFGPDAGEFHDTMVERTFNYLLKKSVEIHESGISVIMDYGFWQETDRQEADEFYRLHNIVPEWHYIDTPNDVWEKSVIKRNAAILHGEVEDYYIDEGLMKKFGAMFEPPIREEIDVWYINEY